MPSIRILTRLSVVSLLGIQLFIETIAYPILEKDKDIKIIKPRFFESGGKSKPLLGGVLLGGGGILAYNHFKGSGNNAGTTIASESLSSSNGGPTASPFLSDGASQGSTDLAASPDTGTGALPGTGLGDGVTYGAGTTAGTGTGALPGTGLGDGVTYGAGTTAGTVPGTTAGTVPGTTAGTVPGTTAGTVPGTTAGTVPGTVPSTLQGAGLGTGTPLVKKDIMRRGENGVLVPDSGWKGSVVKSSLGSIVTVVVGSAVTNLFSGIVSGRRDRKAQQAANREAASVNTNVNDSTYPSYSELKARARRPIEEYQTE